MFLKLRSVEERCTVFNKKVKILDEDSFYEDEKGFTKFILFNKILYCLFSDDNLDNIKILNQDENMEYLINSENNLVGIGICSLTNEEFISLKNAKILD